MENAEIPVHHQEDLLQADACAGMPHNGVCVRNGVPQWGNHKQCDDGPLLVGAISHICALHDLW